VIGAILAVLAFAAAAGLASLSLLQQSSGGTRVVVAKTNITGRTKIQASDLDLATINPAPPQSFTQISAVVGKGARVDIPAGKRLVVAPTIAGDGRKLFDGLPPIHLAQVGSSVSPTGYLLLDYRVVGDPPA